MTETPDLVYSYTFDLEQVVRTRWCIQSPVPLTEAQVADGSVDALRDAAFDPTILSEDLALVVGSFQEGDKPDRKPRG